MRFLADESIPRGLIEALQDHSETVLWLRTEIPGISDQKVLELAQTAPYILLTFDPNLAESAYRAHLFQSSGVILLRLRLLSPKHISEIGAAAIVSRNDWAGHFSIIEGDRVRMRQLPKFGKEKVGGAIEQTEEKEQKAKAGGAGRAKSTRASAAKAKASKVRTSRTRSPKSEQL
ncbi:MAG: hypothetical protein Kow00121_60950 [Elainellaceae cyanobacterium]